MTLSFYTKGGVSYSDSDRMTPYERKIAVQTIREILDDQARAQAEAIEQARLQHDNQAPKSGAHH